MINNNYLMGLAQLMNGESYTIPSYLAFGSTTGTLTAADTVTSGEFDRNILSSTPRSGTVAKFVGSRSAAEANSEVVNVVSLVNASGLGGSGDVQSNFLVASLIHTTSFDVDVEFWVEHKRG